MALQLKSMAVIGAGTMGKGIAQWFAQQGFQVQLVDTKIEIAQTSCHQIIASWKKLVEKKKFTEEQALMFETMLSAKSLEEMNDCDLVIEAIVEKKEIKDQLFKDLDEKLPDHCIFASNTSSLSIAELSQAVSVKRRARFLGLHFFNPATIMKLVEVVGTSDVEDGLAMQIASWFQKHGKEAAQCKDGPGFIVNRLARSFYGEALRIVGDENTEQEREVDSILKQVGGFQMGPFELMDLIGIDINLDVTNIVWNAFHKNPRFAPHPLQEKMVKDGRFGKKTKKGFFSYE